MMERLFKKLKRFFPLILVVVFWAINYLVYAEIHFASNNAFVGVKATTGSAVIRMNYKKQYDVAYDPGVNFHASWNKIIRDEDFDVFGDHEESPLPKWMSLPEFIHGVPLFERLNTPVDVGLTLSVPFLYLFLASILVPMICHRTSTG